MKRTNEESKVAQKRVSLWVTQQTGLQFRGLIDKLNRSKQYGRRVSTDDVIAKAIGLLQPEHFDDICEATLSNTDRLDRDYKIYCESNDPISKDDFIGQLLQKH